MWPFPTQRQPDERKLTPEDLERQARNLDAIKEIIEHDRHLDERGKRHVLNEAKESYAEFLIRVIRSWL